MYCVRDEKRGKMERSGKRLGGCTLLDTSNYQDSLVCLNDYFVSQINIQDHRESISNENKKIFFFAFSKSDDVSSFFLYFQKKEREKKDRIKKSGHFFSFSFSSSGEKNRKNILGSRLVSHIREIKAQVFLFLRFFVWTRFRV